MFNQQTHFTMYMYNIIIVNILSYCTNKHLISNYKDTKIYNIDITFVVDTKTHTHVQLVE